MGWVILKGRCDMLRTRALVVFSGLFCLGLIGQVRAADFFGENMIDVKLALPKGDTYLRGATDPVEGLVAEITLTNSTKKENLGTVQVTVPDNKRLTPDEIGTLETLSKEEQTALVEKKKGTKSIEEKPVNQDSLGAAYVEPQLGPHDVIDFLITRIPEEGEPAPAEGAKPVYVARDNKPDSISRVDLAQIKYLAAGETSPVFTLPVGKYYRVREPGTYSIKAVLRTIGNSGAPNKFAESNTEKFRVLPFKAVNQPIEDVQREWEFFERGIPNFDYLLYQVVNNQGYDEVYCVQRIPVRGIATWEWTRLCSVKSGTTAQVAVLNPKKVAVLAVHHKGDAGLYTLDFSKPGAVVTAKVIDVKEGATPKLKVEAGAASVE